MTYMEKYQLWLEQVPESSPVHGELLELSGQDKELRACFGENLTFGTAGLRGIMGAGTDRMNVYTVRRAALAYGQYIKASTLPDTCVIAYDTRNNGLLFSQTCAAALAECGIQVYLFSKPTPTPVLSFAVRHLHTGGGVVMTASHNPAPYNGMKCYGSDGCQQTDDPAAEVYARMQRLPMISEAETDFDALIAQGKVKLIWNEVYDAYYEAVLGEMLCRDLIPASGLKVLYTPLHGTGLTPVTTLFDRLGVDYDVVTAQATPDGNFPTCSYPNPETEAAFDEAKKCIGAEGAPHYDVIIATDPDADRVAIAVPTENGIRRFSGNELGCMLLEFILNNRLRQGTLPNQSKCIKSIVTTPMVLEIAKRYGCENIDVLTGFKYIGSTILGLEQQGRENEVVFAFEESCGFLKGTYARDKDAQIACILVCALAASCKLEGVSLIQNMERLYSTFGFYETEVVSVVLDGEEGKERCAAFMDSLRESCPATLGGQPVKDAADYRTGVQLDCVTGQKTTLDFPSSNVLSYGVGEKSRVILRPSGTEPKLKIYYFASDASRPAAEQMLIALKADVEAKMKAAGI